MTTVNNKHLVENSESVACTCCCSVMSSKLIEDYCLDLVDSVEEECTAICPLCQVDSIVTDAELGPLTHKVVIRLHHRDFCHVSCDKFAKVKCNCRDYD